jgi:hypothetical protein
VASGLIAWKKAKAWQLLFPVMVIFELPLRRALIAMTALVLSWGLASADKAGMPDLSQEEQTCLPTSTANLIVWFGTHGYPKLIAPGDGDDDAIMTDTAATYQTGTRTDAIAYGLDKYIRDAGYSCDIEYRGLDWSQVKYPEIIKDEEGQIYNKGMKTPAAFSQDWLQENNDPNKGFILLLIFCHLDLNSNTFTRFRAGHAVTLVSAAPDMLLIHDPAHRDDQTGIKILTPETLVGGTLALPGYNAPVSGLLLLSGSLMRMPPGVGVMLTGAVCITMHPTPGNTHVIATAAGSPANTIGGNTPSLPGSAPTTPAVPVSTSQSWATWLFDLVFQK